MQTKQQQVGIPQTLEDIRARREQLAEELAQARSEISGHWYQLVTPQKTNTRGELVAALISNAVTAFDAFLLVRKLLRGYHSLFGQRKRR